MADIKVYKTNNWKVEIDEVVATRLTDSRVYYMDRGRETWSPKNGNYFKYFNTYSEAKQHMLSEAEKEINKYKGYIENLIDKIKEINKL